MNTILEQYKDKINATFSFLTGLYKGTYPAVFFPSGKKYFLSQKDILLKDFPAYANQVTNDIVTHAEEFTASLKRPLVYLTSAKIPKEQTALAVLEEPPLEEGLICKFYSEAFCQS